MSSSDDVRTSRQPGEMEELPKRSYYLVKPYKALLGSVAVAVAFAVAVAVAVAFTSLIRRLLKKY